MPIIVPKTTEDSFELVPLSLKNPTLFPGPTNWYDVGRFREGTVCVRIPKAVGSGISVVIWAQTTDDDPEHQPDDTLWKAFDLYHDNEMKSGDGTTRDNKRNVVNGAGTGSVPGSWRAIYKHLACRYLRLDFNYGGSFGGSDGFTWGARFVGK